jgi:hypothetical protein
MRRRITEPPFCRGPSIGSDALIALLDELQDIIRRYAGGTLVKLCFCLVPRGDMDRKLCAASVPSKRTQKNAAPKEENFDPMFDPNFDPTG